MKTSSGKAKGHRLEALVAKKIKEVYNLTEDDIRISVGSETGADVKLSNKAKVKFPYSVECKARASYTTLYKFYEQASKHYPELIPIVVIKGDRKEPLVLINLDHFLTVINKKEK